MSHDAVHAQMDVKLRSLICLGLNEQVSSVQESCKLCLLSSQHWCGTIELQN